MGVGEFGPNPSSKYYEWRRGVMDAVEALSRAFGLPQHECSFRARTPIGKPSWCETKVQRSIESATFC